MAHDGKVAQVNVPSRLTVKAVDDGLPANPGRLSYTWSKVSGPGTVTFSPNGTPLSAGCVLAGCRAARIRVQ